MTEEDVSYYLGTLAGSSDNDRAISLQNLAKYPTGDPRVLEALEKLLDDKTPCLLQIPYRFGEMRLLAAAALAAERWAAGDQRPVRLHTTIPITSDQLDELRQAAKVDRPAYKGDVIAAELRLFALLRERRFLPEVDLELRHPVHIGWIDSGE
jgi:hypothetical protein